MILPPVSVSSYGQLVVAAAVAKTIKPYLPVAFSSGRESYFDGSPGVYQCNEPRAWSQLWDRHLQNQTLGSTRGVANLSPAPGFDFNANLVVAMFAGPTRGVVGYRVVTGYLFGKKATVRLAPVPSDSRTEAVALPQPYAFLVLPRTSATVEIQMASGDGWTTVATVKPSL